MIKSNKNALKRKREEQQAKKVIKIVLLSFVILALVMLIAYSFLG